MNNFSNNHEELSLEKQRAAKKSTLVSVAINFILSIAQILTGWLAGSRGLIADGIHSLSDLLSDFIVLLANQHSSKEADHDHNYGHQRYETAASLFLGLSLLVVGGAMLWKAGEKIIYPTTNAQIQIAALWVALGGMLAKEFLFRYMLQVAQKVKSSMLVANAWHARSDAASSLVVVMGIVGALMGYPILDSVGALVIGLIIAKIGLRFSWQALHELMDKSASEEEHKKIAEIITRTNGVKGFHSLKTRKMGDMILVDVHIEVDEASTVKVGHNIALEATNKIMANLPVLNVMTHVDPV